MNSSHADHPKAHAGLPGQAIRTLSTPLGPMLAAASQRGVTLLEFHDRPDLARQIAAITKPDDADHPAHADTILAELERTLRDYFSDPNAPLDVPLDPRGTPFQIHVWSALRQIPPGRTTSYAQLARALGQPTAIRAVAAANARNAIAILIPCHRVIGTDGSLTGYAGGVDRKRWLLDHEHATRTLFM